METRALVRIAIFAAMIAVLGLAPRFDIPFAGGVPITAQTLGVMLAGVMLGPRDGALSTLLFLFVVALGAPLLAGGRGGLGAFAGPSVGFLIGWVAGAFACGLLMRWLRSLGVFAAAMLAAIGGGIVVVYAFGAIVLAWKMDSSLLHAMAASMVFLPGDLLKALATALIAGAVKRADPKGKVAAL